MSWIPFAEQKPAAGDRIHIKFFNGESTTAVVGDKFLDFDPRSITPAALDPKAVKSGVEFWMPVNQMKLVWVHPDVSTLPASLGARVPAPRP